MQVKKSISKDGTIKYLFTAKDGKFIETVFIPQKTTNVVCISSQIGCALACKFCVTGYAGFSRNLRAEEIVEQYTAVVEDQSLEELPNIVFMGMGEPLLNLTQVKQAINYLHDDLHLSKKKITISTVGIVDKFAETAEIGCQFALSLHAPNDILRSKIMPIAEKHTLHDVFDGLRHFAFSKNKPLMIEYILLKDINDKKEHAQEMISLLQQYDFPYLINLIPYNEHMYADFQRSAGIGAFKHQLIEAGLKTFVRESRGEDIAAACGLLKQTHKI